MANLRACGKNLPEASFGCKWQEAHYFRDVPLDAGCLCCSSHALATCQPALPNPLSRDMTISYYLTCYYQMWPVLQ